jgi:hypothetical protein
MALTHIKLNDMAVRVLKDIFSETADLDFLTAFESYYGGLGDFLDEDIGLELMKQMYEAKVSLKAVIIQFFLYEFAIDMLTILLLGRRH